MYSYSDFIHEFDVIKKSERENIMFLALNDSYNIIDKQLNSTGTDSACCVFFSRLREFIDSTKCSKIIMCHNHPHALVEPSNKDIKLTSYMKNYFASNGIELIDHIIINTRKNSKPFSFLDHKMMED